MRKRKKRALKLLAVVLACVICTVVLGCVAVWRSGQVQEQGQVPVSGMQQEKAPELPDIFWSGDRTLLTRDNVVVFDVRYNGTDNNILISLAECIQEEIKNKGIQAIFLGAETDGELRTELLTCGEMDLYIGLSVGADEADVFGTKCFYNEAYYTPDYNSVQLCDKLLQNVVTNISGKALGMEICDDRDILIGMDVPACLLQIGYRTHAKEGALLQERAYLEKIAAGIVAVVEEYYEGE